MKIKDNPGLIDRMNKLAFAESIPITVTLELTLKCNLRCVHCYNFDRQGSAPKTRKGEELKPHEVYRILDEVAQTGALIIVFTGGEAMVHPHLVDYVKYARKLHFGVRIKSNATLLTPERARELAEAGVTDMDVSIYGARAETHDAFTTVRGSFERSVRGIIAAREAGIHLSLSIILHRGNYRELQEMRALAEELDVAFAVSTELTARYDGTTSSQDHRLDRDALEEIYDPETGIDPRELHSPTGQVQCSCARTVCGITSTGDVYPCIGAPIRCGSVREQSFGEIWRNSRELNRIRGLTIDDFETCKPCPHRNACQRSSGGIYTNTGNYTGPEPWTCMEAEIIHRKSSAL